MSVRRARRTGFAAVVALAVVALPRLAAACAVCGAGANDGSVVGFLIGTILLSLTPLALIGGAVFYLLRRARRIAAEEADGVIRLPERPARPATGAASAASPGSAPRRAPQPARG